MSRSNSSGSAQSNIGWLDSAKVGKKMVEAVTRRELSPRHVPDEIHQVPGIPRTLSGKKLEVPVRKILLGTPVAEAADPDALANPEVLGLFAPRDESRVESGPGDAQRSTVIEGNA